MADIAAETRKVGNALTSVRIDQMILSLAKGIAWGQFELDKVGVEVLKMMGVPGTVNVGQNQISMLDAGFTPSFYQFVDTILEIKMEVNIREEKSQSTKTSESSSSKTSFSAKSSFEANFLLGKASGSVAFSTSQAYSRSVDTQHSQKFSQDLAASSLIRTKIVPLPPPDILLERIRIELDRIKEELEEEKQKEGAEINFEDIKNKYLKGIFSEEELA